MFSYRNGTIFAETCGNLGALLGRLGALLWASWAVMGRSWAPLGPSWTHRRPKKHFFFIPRPAESLSDRPALNGLDSQAIHSPRQENGGRGRTGAPRQGYLRKPELASGDAIMVTACGIGCQYPCPNYASLIKHCSQIFDAWESGI